MKYIFRMLFILCAIALQAKTVNFTILTFNDVYEIVPDSFGRGGFAEMQTLLLQERARAKHHITTVNGDFLSPCVLSFFDKGAHRIDLFNHMDIDIVALGNHEFDFGPDEVLKRIEESNFPWLAANAIGTNGIPFTGEKQKIILDVEGVKVGIFGLITVETPELSSTEQKVCFSPLVYTAKKIVQELREEGADVIIALTHLFMGEDKQLSEEVPEIDVILGGHDHDPITWYNDKTFIHKSGQNAYYLARVDLTIEKNETNGKVMVFPSWQLILNKDTPQDPVLGERVAELQKVFHAITSEPLGVLQMSCDTLYSNVRSKESEFANLVTDALLEYCNADMSIISGGIIRGNRFYEPGYFLTLRDLLVELPFGNSNVLIEIPGRAVMAALENGVSQVEGKAGRFPQVSGLSFTYDINQPPGQRIQDVYVKGVPLDLDRIYRVATVDYMFNGGDGYSSLKSGKVLLSPLKKISLVNTLAAYIKQMPSVYQPLEDRITVKGSTSRLDQNVGL